LITAIVVARTLSEIKKNAVTAARKSRSDSLRASRGRTVEPGRTAGS
jgi:hypothetical protein